MHIHNSSTVHFPWTAENTWPMFPRIANTLSNWMIFIKISLKILEKHKNSAKIMKNMFFTRKYFSEKVLKPTIFMETNPHLVIPVSVEFLVTFAPKYDAFWLTKNVVFSNIYKLLCFYFFWTFEKRSFLHLKTLIIDIVFLKKLQFL